MLLDYLRVESLILTGVAANICVLFTANDAYMRDFHLFVPGDCVASNTEELNRAALEQMHLVLKADTRPSDELDRGRCIPLALGDGDLLKTRLRRGRGGIRG
ncbi:MAG: isochorismatase family protein [Singulisphaera sp.]